MQQQQYAKQLFRIIGPFPSWRVSCIIYILLKFTCISDQVYATLEEFVDFITTVSDDKDTNEFHWMPIEQYCSPCTIDYDIMIKTETMSEDLR